jgi:hypothetical protein
VDAVASPKVRYFRTPEPLAMSHNWEFGLAQTRGEYVILIGDDDGLLPHALGELHRISNSCEVKAIQWSAAYYTWPTFAIPGQGDYLRIPLECTMRERNGLDVIRNVVAFRDFYTDLPMLYNAAVRRDVLEQLRRRTGRVIPHPIPDIYSGFAIAYTAGTFLSTTVPMSVSGQSKASNGIATLFNRGRSEIDREFHALNSKDGLRHEPTVPDLPVFPHVPVADSFVFAKRALFPELDITLDRRALTRTCLNSTRVSEAEWPTALRIIRNSLADSPELQQWFDTQLADAPYKRPPAVEMRSSRLGFDGRYLHLDAAAFGVTDVQAAATLCDHLLNYRQYPPEYTEQGAAAKKIAELQAVCNEREQAILRLHLDATNLQRQCDERELLIRNYHSRVVELDQRLREADANLMNERRWSIKRPLRVVKRLLSSASRIASLMPRGANTPKASV